MGFAGQHTGFPGTVTDKMIPGTLDMTIGKNTTFAGGTVYGDIHHDAVIGRMTQAVDSVTVTRDWEFMPDERIFRGSLKLIKKPAPSMI